MWDIPTVGREVGMQTAAGSSTVPGHQQDMVRSKGTQGFSLSRTSPCSILTTKPFPSEPAPYGYARLPCRAAVLPEFPHLFLITS